MIKLNILSMIKEKKENFDKERAKYEEAVNKSLQFENLLRLDIKNKNIVNEGRVEQICLLCPNLTKDLAIKIDNTIPIWETYLFIFVIQEKKTNNKYYLIATDRWIWIINEYCYKIIKYEEIYLIEILRRALMNQVITFNQIILTISDYINNVNDFVKFIKDNEYRQELIEKKKEYLCGIIPVYQNLSKIGTGISIDKDGTIVLHDRFKNNIKCIYDEIEDYELLEDQTAVLKKKKENDIHSIPFTKNSCSRISIRVTFKNNTLFMMTILEPSAFYNQYNHTDSIYMTNIKFARNIIETLERFNKNIK